MADLIPLGTNFDLGFQSDVSRDEMNSRAAYRMSDWIPQLEAPLRKRGGWSYASPDLNDVGGSATLVTSVGFLSFPGDGHVLAVSDGGYLYQIKQFDGGGGTVVSDSGDKTIVPSWPIFFHKTGTTSYGIILDAMRNLTGKVPKKYYDTSGGASLTYTSAPLGGTPPMARAGFSWGDYLVLLNYFDPSDSNKLHNNRWAFSDPGNPDSWSLSGANASTFDFPEEMVAGVPVLNSILALGYNDCHILTGDTPPPGGNLERKILFAGLGTMDGRSAVPWRNYAIWANTSGVWQSDGATLTDLAATGGISTYYRQLVTGFSFSQGWKAVAGIYRDHYVLNIRNSSNQAVVTLVCDLSRKVWTTWSNFLCGGFARRAGGPGTSLFGGDEELFFAHNGIPRVGAVSSLWTPSATYASDADGTAVMPTLETPYYRVGSLDEKRIRRIFLGYDLRSSVAAPTLGLSYTTAPEAGAAYTAMASLPVTTQYKRRSLRVGKAALGIGFKIAQTGASADTRLYSLETDAHPWESER